MTRGPASGPLDIVSDLVPKRRSNMTCDVMELRLTRPDLAAQYDLAVADGRFSAASIAVWLTDHGYPIAGTTIGRHARNECVRCRQTS